MSKPASHPTASAGELDLHVTIVPPTALAGQNLEQDFTAIVKPELQQPQFNGQIAHGWVGPLLPVRVKQVDWRGEAMTAAERLATPNGPRIEAAAAAMRVPIVFFYEPVLLVLELKNPLTGKTIWKRTMDFQLPEAGFPRPPLASTVREVTSSNGERVGIDFKVKAWEMFAEQFEWAGREKAVQLATRDDAGRPFTVQMGVQRVQNAASKEPMTYFMGERVWGMRSIAVVADPSMWKE